MSQNKAKPIRDLLREKDAFLTAGEKIIEYSLRHPRLLAGAALALMLAAAGLYGYLKSRETAEREASAAYELALASPTPAEAAAALERLRSEAPGRQAARLAALSLIRLYSETGTPEKALPLAEDMLKTLKPAEISLRPVLLENLGGLYELAGDYRRAAENYQALLAWPALPENYKPGLLAALGRVRQAAGERAEAIKVYEELARDFSGSFQAYMGRSRLAELKAEDPAAPPAAAPPAPGAPQDGQGGSRDAG